MWSIRKIPFFGIPKILRQENENIQKNGLRKLPEGTVILSSRAPIGKVAVAGKEMYYNQGFKCFI
ncbi:MAG: hypothetical protein HFI16_00265 [Lachnospiraceae bacterium]|nr:hypothetical protein [Lachnospiraceae bacterium]